MNIEEQIRRDYADRVMWGQAAYAGWYTAAYGCLPYTVSMPIGEEDGAGEALLHLAYALHDAGCDDVPGLLRHIADIFADDAENGLLLEQHTIIHPEERTRQ